MTDTCPTSISSSMCECSVPSLPDNFIIPEISLLATTYFGHYKVQIKTNDEGAHFIQSHYIICNFLSNDCQLISKFLTKIVLEQKINQN